ncbi:NADH-quinone oxidoreductase subunit G [Mycolicibacterium sp. BiH015]|uniref:NADH-quinone oxidoreductase subunit G n=1 Tax=Mycolicibacterium sp. BiH015 TaxID=3018808 RepID=UPI0022E4C847|nr:NADH-quinone oxidoreductase subunit G [Mycolicibacterium sp. BiH015]MDA2895192.1 NADH-quinone oxidoreductase subunit G [Mycolicibacterium sp. BiH015]
MRGVDLDLVSLTIDGRRVAVPRDTLVIRAAETIGVQIPRFCDHPLLDPVGACRQCLVEIEGQRKPVASCTTVVSPDMVVRTQFTSVDADSAQRGVMELLLINHPLDCPVCDKGGECPLQNQAMSSGRAESRFDKVKRTYPKPIPLSTQVLLDRERCVLCARCTRFSEQIAGDPFIELMERGALQQVGAAEGEPFDSYFSGNTVQICPVGALTGSAYRFRARPFDLISSPSVCEHCACGCAQRTDHRRGRVLRRLAGDDPDVNEEWNCDKGRWAFGYPDVGDRICTPLIRRHGELTTASWPEALAVAAAGLHAAAGRAGVIVGGRVTVDDAEAYAEFARKTLCTNDIDFRVRTHSAEEADFLAARVAGVSTTPTYAELESASLVVLAGLDPEEEAPLVFLRLRKAVRRRGLEVLAVAPWVTRGLEKLQARLVMTRPGDEADVLARLDLLQGAIVMVGERLAGSAGALTAAAHLVDRAGARLAWIPRRAGDRGALEAGCLPGLLPGGRPVTNPRAREQVAAAWRTNVPAAAGRDTSAMVAAAGDGLLDAIVVGGVDLADLPDPVAAERCLERTGFIVSLELRHSTVTAAADVVLPVASVAEKSGAFLNWEGRLRPFASAMPSPAMSDAAVLQALSTAMGRPLCGSVALRTGWNGRRADLAPVPDAMEPLPRSGEAILATWKTLLDNGRMQDGSAALAGTARTVVARISAATAAEIGVADGDPIVVFSSAGEITAPVRITAMPDRVVWLPEYSAGCAVHRTLRVGAGALVGVRA